VHEERLIKTSDISMGMAGNNWNSWFGEFFLSSADKRVISETASDIRATYDIPPLTLGKMYQIAQEYDFGLHFSSHIFCAYSGIEHQDGVDRKFVILPDTCPYNFGHEFGHILFGLDCEAECEYFANKLNQAGYLKNKFSTFRDLLLNILRLYCEIEKDPEYLEHGLSLLETEGIPEGGLEMIRDDNERFLSKMNRRRRKSRTPKLNL
jgi:hypothetical protein